MSKLRKIGLFGLMALVLIVGVGASMARADLTVAALTITSSGALTLDGAAASNVNLGAATTSGVIAIGVANTGGINVGAGNTAKTINLGTGTAIDTINVGTGATGVDVIRIGQAAADLALTDAQWSITSPGVATFVNGLVSPSATLGLDVGSAGNLQLGGVTATSIGVGSAAVTAITLTTDSTGTGEVVLPNDSISTAEIADNTIDVSNLAASLAFADADLVSFASVSVSSTTEGLILPQHATDCSTAGTAEGQVCWEADANVLYIGDGATVAAITPNTASNNTWTGTNAFNGTSVTLGDAVTDGLTVTSAIQGASPLVFDGATDDTNELTLAVADVGADVTITLPSATGTLATLAGTETLSNKTLTAPALGVATGTSLAVTGLVTTSSPSAAFGYATGAGCAVTQITNRSTGVTCTGNSGAITTDTTALAAGAEATFTVTDTSVAVGDTVIVSIRSGSVGGTPLAFVSTVAAGSFAITLTNLHATTDETGAIIINFAVVKAVSA